MIAAVLRPLELPDLLNCRRVSKRFRDVLDLHLIKELFIFGNWLVPVEFMYRSPTFWLRSKQPANNFLALPNFQTFRNLRSLSIAISVPMPLNLNGVFSGLQRLYIWTINLGVRQSTLFLPNLRILLILNIQPIDVRDGGPPPTTLRIETPELRKLSCERLDQIELVHYESVSHLTIRKLRASNLSSFTSLRVLTLDLNEDPLISERHVDEFVDSISNLSELKRVRFHWAQPTIESRFINQAVRQIIETEKDWTAFLFNIPVTKQTRATLIHQRLIDQDEEFQAMIANYDRLSILPEEYCEMQINYHHLSDDFKRRTMPGVFVRKFRNIRNVSSGPIRMIDDLDWFFSLVNSCKDLNHLRLNITGLQRPFFDRLSLNRLSLHNLTLDGENQQIDYSFIYNFDYLQELRISQALNSQNIILLFERCENLNALISGSAPRKFAAFKIGEIFNLMNVSVLNPWHQGWFRLTHQAWMDLCRFVFDDGNQLNPFPFPFPDRREG